MIEAALILALAIIVSSLVKTSKVIKPKRILAQITVIGPTERGEETMQLVGSIYESDSVEEIDSKVKKLTEVMERRRQFCNQRMLEITGSKEEILEEAKKVCLEAGLKFE